MSPSNFTGHGNGSILSAKQGRITCTIHKTTCVLWWRVDRLQHLYTLFFFFSTDIPECRTTSFESNFTWEAWYYGLCHDLANLHLNEKALEYTVRNLWQFLVNNTFVSQQINRSITQTNISHRNTPVERPIPDEKWGGRAVYSFCHSLQYPYCWNTQFPKENTTSSKPTPQHHSRQYGARQPRLIWTTPWCDGFQYIICLHIRFRCSKPERRLPGSQHLTCLTTFIRMG